MLDRVASKIERQLDIVEFVHHQRLLLMSAIATVRPCQLETIEKLISQ